MAKKKKTAADYYAQAEALKGKDKAKKTDIPKAQAAVEKARENLAVARARAKADRSNANRAAVAECQGDLVKARGDLAAARAKAKGR